MKPAPSEPPGLCFSPRADLREFLRSSAPDSAPPQEPCHGHVAANKGSPFYRAHTYHTKVPPQGIEPFIRYFAPSGGVVLDPFCGSGMTGVAALATGRRAVLSDLSPAAAFIAYNHCSPADAAAYLAKVREVVGAAQEIAGALYDTACADCGASTEIAYTVWSERYRCPKCRRTISQWRDGLDPELRVRPKLPCPGCRGEFHKHSLTKLGHEPVLLHVDCPTCGRREQAPSRADRALVRRLSRNGVLDGSWYPRDPVRADTDEIKRVLRDGVTTVAQFFTPRNLLALAALYEAIGRVRPRALRQKLLFTFTASIPRASRTNKYIPHLHAAPGPIIGTMYLPGFYPELNVWRHFRKKAVDIARAMRAAPAGVDVASSLRVQVCSATRLANVPDRSIDYVFTDPPFGANISYSDLNFIWEAWLGRRTARAREAVVSQAQQKSVEGYGELMRQSFAEIHRVLKPGRWMTLVFHNTAADVWDALLAALADARLHPEAIYTFDKQQSSFKQVTADGAVDCDVVLHCRRESGAANGRRHTGASCEEVTAYLRQALESESEERDARRLARRLYSRAIADFLRRGKRLDLDFRSFRVLLAETRDLRPT